MRVYNMRLTAITADDMDVEMLQQHLDTAFDDLAERHGIAVAHVHLIETEVKADAL